MNGIYIVIYYIYLCNNVDVIMLITVKVSLLWKIRNVTMYVSNIVD